MPKKRQFTEELKGHFFATSIAEWRTGVDREKLVRAMKAGGFPFTLIWVPLPADAHYEIDNFLPVVDGCAVISEFNLR